MKELLETKTMIEKNLNSLLGLQNKFQQISQKIEQKDRDRN